MSANLYLVLCDYSGSGDPASWQVENKIAWTAMAPTTLEDARELMQAQQSKFPDLPYKLVELREVASEPFNPMVDNASQPHDPADTDPGDDGYEWGCIDYEQSIESEPMDADSARYMAGLNDRLTLVRRRMPWDEWESAS